jgi:plastocyanin
MRRIVGARRAFGVMLAVMAACTTGNAAELRVTVGSAGQPVVDAVVSLHGKATPARDATARMEQQHSTFAPGILPVQVGTVVSFPNRDNIQHQVYSFSQAKQFEIPLYAGNNAAPVRFDRAGVVVVGCNIHDWMIGHIVVVDTPYFAKTPASGAVRLDVPPGTYTLRVWHARSETVFEKTVVIPAAGSAHAVGLVLAATAPEARGNDRLRALQDKFRRLKGAQ